MTATPHVVIRASAGSGKTHALTTRYLDLVSRGVPPERVLATTFTRKAAGEILGRVLSRLAGAAAGGKPRDDLAEALGRPVSAAEVAKTLRALVSRLHRLRISTIDSFFAQLATSFALELELPARWRIATEDEDERLRAAALSAMLAEDAGRVEKLVRALGGGASKRSVAAWVAEEIGKLYELFLDAPASAWGHGRSGVLWDDEERARDVAELLEASGRDGKMLPKALRDVAELLRRDRLSDLVDETLVKNVRAKKGTLGSTKLDAEVVDLVARVGERASATIRDRLDDHARAASELCAAFHGHYRREKARAGLVRFEDVTRALADAAILDRLDEVYFRLDGRLDHVLLDEFQDTSLAQWSVLFPLAESLASDATGEDSLFVVGDVKQAIYGWRGGEAAIFRGITRRLPSLREEPLDRSRRSARAVIETVNTVFEDVRQGGPAFVASERGAKTWTSGFRRHETAIDADGHVRLVVGPAPAKGEVARDVHFRFAAERVKELAARAPRASIGVLTRSNAALAQLVFHLRVLEVPVSEEGGGALVDSPAVTPILSVLTLADHPEHGVARFHVATSPLGPVVGLRDPRDDAAARRVAREVRADLLAHGYASKVRELARAVAPRCGERDARRLDQLVELAARWERHATLRPSDFVAHVKRRRVPDPSGARVRVMTVHGAKGLEQDIVVLPELGKELIDKQPDWLVERDPETRVPTRILAPAKTAERAALPDLLKDLRAEAEARDVEEELSGLYVALTRARTVLEILLEPTEKPPAKDWAGVVRHALAPDAQATAGTVLYERGDARCLDALGAEATPTRAAAVAPELGLVVPATRRRALPRTSPSSLEGVRAGGLVDVKGLLRLDEGARLRGTVLHAMLEQIGWLEDGVPGDDVLRAVARGEGAGDERAAELVRELHAALAEPELREALTRAAREQGGVRAEVRRELRFALRDDGAILSGSIDRLVVLRDAAGNVLRAEVSDFKTDRVDGEEALRARSEHYRPQLEAYGRAVARLYAIDVSRVARKLLFVSPGRAVSV